MLLNILMQYEQKHLAVAYFLMWQLTQHAKTLPKVSINGIHNQQLDMSVQNY